MTQDRSSSSPRLTRVIRIDRGHVRIAGGEGDDDRLPITPALAELHLAVGDYLQRTPDGQVELVPRTARLARATKTPPFTQVLAANVDIVFLALPLTAGARPHVIERLAALGWASGAQPHFLLTKADLVTTEVLIEMRLTIEQLAPGIPIVVTSVEEGSGIQEVRDLIAHSGTAVIIGHSGVGKSSVLNALLGFSAQAVGATRERDAKGRHTTTHRELVDVPTGGCLIDTPGLRELGMEVERRDLERVFGDVAELAAACRFADCTHAHEPGCAVVAAVDEGALDRDRLESMQHLEREARHNQAKRGPQQREKDREWTRRSREYRRARGH